MDTSSESDGDEVSHVISTSLSDRRSVYKKQLALCLLLGSILFERITFYSLTNSIKTTLTSNMTVAWSSEHSETASSTFFGTRYICTFVFAALCDARLGRPKTIVLGYIFYLIGSVLMIIMSNDTISFCHLANNNTHHNNATSVFQEPCSPGVFLILICIALGVGTTQSNLAVFAGEQIQDLKSISRYAGTFQIVLNIGDITAIVATSYIKDYSEHFYTMYTAITGVLLISILLFFIAYRYSTCIQPYDTVLTKFIQVCINAYRSKKSYQQRERSYNLNEQPLSFLDYAKIVHHGQFQDRIVNDAKALVRTVIVFSLLIPYWIMYNQINTTFVKQGNRMYSSSNNDSTIVSKLVVPITIIVGLLVFEILSYKYFDSWKKEFLLIIKFILGMCFAILAMIVAGSVECIRQNKCIEKTSKNSELSIANQILQYALIGLSEVFGVVASFEFAYYTSPRSAQSLFMSFRFTAAGVAQFVNTGFSNSFLQLSATSSSCLSFGNAEPWRYYTYFFLLAGFQCLFLIIFIVCCKKNSIIQLNPEQIKPTMK